MIEVFEFFSSYFFAIRSVFFPLPRFFLKVIFGELVYFFGACSAFASFVQNFVRSYVNCGPVEIFFFVSLSKAAIIVQ